MKMNFNKLVLLKHKSKGKTERKPYRWCRNYAGSDGSSVAVGAQRNQPRCGCALASN